MTLTPAKLKFIAARAAGATVRSAARHAGCSERTGQRLDVDPEVRAAIDELADLRFQAASRELKSTAKRATRTLRRCLSAATAADRIRSARSILEYVLKVKEHELRAVEVAALRAEVEELQRLFAERYK
jgi:hypothetical protein